MHFTEQNRPRVHPDFSQSTVERNHAGKDFPGKCAALLDLLEDAFVNQVIKLRNDSKCGDVALAESSQQFGGVEGLKVDDARALDERQQEICHLRQNVEQR